MGQHAASPTLLRARDILRRLAEDTSARDTSAHGSQNIDRVELAVALAGLLVTEANRRRDDAQAARLQMLAALMEDPRGQVFTTLLTDRAFRSADASRWARELAHLIDALGVPRYLSAPERIALRAARYGGMLAPKQAQQGLLQRLRDQTRAVIIPAQDHALSAHLAARKAAGIAVNVNHLGEAVLSEQDAIDRFEHYRALLMRDDVQTISVKVSSICSQLSLLAWDTTLDRLCARLHNIYSDAIVHSKGTSKLIYLDMEAYRDLHLTLVAFRRVLDAPEHHKLTAGIVLQAYLPDSFALQQELTAWAMARVASGGAPIRLRLVKGANLAMESVESSLRGWPLPTFSNKRDSDANFKRMLDYACQPEHTAAVRIGIASHNAFDLAYALVVAHGNHVQDHVDFELLEGMADPLLDTLNELTGRVLVYAPIVEDSDMQSAIAYLIRRLDENTAPENFLRHSFTLRTNSAAWVEQEQRFRDAWQRCEQLSSAPHRTQDRNQAPITPGLDAAFDNEPDTDFGLACNRAWIHEALDHWRADATLEIASCVAGVDRFEGNIVDGFDPSRPDHVPYRFALADAALIEQALSTGTQAAKSWAQTSLDERDRILHAVADELRSERGALIAAMVLDAGKAVLEGDVEVSEAIDFAEYYRRSARELFARDDVQCAPRGLVLVTPPWNFPLAIAAGGVLAALATGNAVILKPALETVLVARRLCDVLWNAGVPRDVVQLLICEDELGSTLIKDARIDAVILTGASDTARLFRRMRPELCLLAETGGKNAIVISAMSDWDLAIKDLLQSAFGHSGQKCSAASLAICEAEVYDSPSFRRRLAEAAQSMCVGSAWSVDSIVTPLIHPPRGALQRGLKHLDPGEAWLLDPKCDPKNPRLWSPGIRMHVQDGSFCHQTELFGPVLSLMRARDLDHAITLVNNTTYGLTSGLFSLNEREQARWIDRVQAGNLYVNRGITGAIVRRQPFGGTKASTFGPGAKAGGPNYLTQLVHMTSRRATPDYAAAFARYYSRPQDPSRVLGQDNQLQHVRCERVCVLVTSSARAIDVETTLHALDVIDHRVEIATLDAPPACLALIHQARRHTHTDHDIRGLIEHLKARQFLRVRVIGALPSALLDLPSIVDTHFERSTVSNSGRVELRHYLRERSLSFTYHRYGNLSRIPSPT